MITYDRNGGDMTVNVTAGNGMGCWLRAQLFDESGAPDPGGPSGTIFDNWIDDGLQPEYTIPSATLAKNSKLFILHTYSAAPIVAGSFTAISEFSQDSDKQADLTHAQTGGDVYRKIILEGH